MTSLLAGIVEKNLSLNDLHIDSVPRCIGRYDMELGDITPHNVEQLRRLNQAVFPVSYNDKFYKDIVSAGELAKLAYFNDIVVGAINNDIAVKFYTHHGFQIVGVAEKYYKRIEPDSAYILTKKVTR
ncbi:unnamed protein product [Dracunculus medinensis]|uniref:N-acetyltransferase domain-containing protein n=1 Tax=Dracunculus medinensis TaxID=318479 RepID=A0A0N4UHQ4_DRAME|nr:unnamed protein product [Dracunculus medinensis]